MNYSLYKCFPPEDSLDLLRGVLHPDIAESRRAWARWRASNTLEGCDLKMHRLMPLLYRRFQREGLAPADLKILRGVYRYNWTRNQLALRAAQNVSSHLQKHGVSVLLLKGLPLMLTVYKDRGVRPMWDFDLLIRPEQQKLAVGLLRELGWTSEQPCPEPSASHAYELRGPHNQSLDLHWFCSHASRWPGADDDFWEQSLPLSLDDSTLGPSPIVGCLRPEHSLVHVCIHGTRFDSNQDLGWICDAWHILAQQSLDWEVVLETAQRHRVASALFLAFSFLREKVNADIPSSVLCGLNRQSKSWPDRLYFHLTVRGGSLNFWMMPCLDYLRWEGRPSLRGFLEYLRKRWFLERWTQLPGSAIKRVGRRFLLVARARAGNTAGREE